MNIFIYFKGLYLLFGTWIANKHQTKLEKFQILSIILPLPILSVSHWFLSDAQAILIDARPILIDSRVIIELFP